MEEKKHRQIRKSQIGNKQNNQNQKKKQKKKNKKPRRVNVTHGKQKKSAPLLFKSTFLLQMHLCKVGKKTTKKEEAKTKHGIIHIH